MTSPGGAGSPRFLMCSRAVPWPDRLLQGSFHIEQALGLRSIGAEMELFGAGFAIPNWLGRRLSRFRDHCSRPLKYRVRGVQIYAPRVRFPFPPVMRHVIAAAAPRFVDRCAERTKSKALAQTIERSRPDVLLGHGMIPWASTLQRASRDTGVPHAYIEHSAIDVLRINPGTRLADFYRGTAEQARAVFVVGPQMLEHATEVLRWPNVHLLPNGARPAIADVPPRPSKLAGKKIVLAAANYYRRKGFEELVDALPGALDHHPSLEVHIITDAPPSLRRRAESRIPAGRVHFHDPMLGDELLHWMHWSDLFVLPSWDEAFGLVYAEALLQGCGVIATEDSGFARYCTLYESKYGLRPATTVLPRNTEGLTEAIVSLLEDEDRMRWEREAGRDMVDRWFSWRSNAITLRDTLFDEPTQVAENERPEFPPRVESCPNASRASIRSSASPRTR
ncbi:MAG: glycosyltransferase [Planctomycetota bacterium]